MRILLVIPDLSKGGAERMVVNIARFLQKNKHSVEVIIFRNQISYPIEDLNIKVVDIDVQLAILKKSKVNVRLLQEAVDLFEPEIIHSHLFESEIALSQIKVSIKTKRIVHFHDNMPQFLPFTLNTLFTKRTLTNYFERRIVLRNLKKNYTEFISISKHSKEYVSNCLGNNFPIHLLPNGIDLNQFKGKKRDVSDDDLTCAMIGSFVDKKGQKLAIETVFELKHKGHFITLYLIGDGELLEELKQLTIELNLEDRIVFTGNINQPQQYLQATDFYLHTAKEEAMGLVLIEAMACGNPIICTNGGGNVDLIKEGENGFLIDVRNPVLLANKIEYFIENRKKLNLMSEEAFLFAQKYSIINYIEKLETIYTTN